MTRLAKWIMDRLTDEGGSEWGVAMRREFDELDHGQLAWALGCLIAKFRCAFSKYLELGIALIAIHILGPVFAMILNGFLISAGITSLTYKLAFCYAAPWATLLGMRHPTSVFFISVVGGVVLPLVIGFGSAAVFLKMSIADYFVGDTVFLSGLYGIGFLSSLALWFACTSIGGRIARRADKVTAA